MLMYYFVLRGICLTTFSHDAVRILASPESTARGRALCKTGELWILIISIHTSRFGIGLSRFDRHCYSWMGTYTWNQLYSKILPAESCAQRHHLVTVGQPSQAKYQNSATGPYFILLRAHNCQKMKKIVSLHVPAIKL